MDPLQGVDELSTQEKPSDNTEMDDTDNSCKDECKTSPCSVDNSTTVINKIANLYAERLMSDVCLVVGNVEYPSHRLILCASSDVFQVMLMNSNWSSSRTAKVVLGETPACASVFEDFLRYMYTGKIQLDYATVIPLVSLADKYNVKDLLRLGLEYMARNVSTAAKKHQIVTWYQFATSAGHRKLAELTGNFIKWNFEVVSKTLDYSTLDLNQLIYFLEANDLVVYDEMTLFTCIYRWLEEKKSLMIELGEENIDLHLDHFINVLLSRIRFPMMTPSQLADLLLNPLSQTHTELLVERIRMAMCYHKNQLELSEKGRVSTSPNCAINQQVCPRGNKNFTPRLYTVDKFCGSLSIDYFYNLQSYHCRTLLLTSQKFTAEWEGTDDHAEWVVDMYPKGVWFQRCLTVYRPPGMEVPERVLKTVRVSVSTRSEENQRVRIGLLLIGSQDNFEHVRSVATRNYFFSEDDQIVNFDDILDYDELNDLKEKSPFLSGDSLKLLIVIAPLSKFSSLT